jgi:hypothetical protein
MDGKGERSQRYQNTAAVLESRRRVNFRLPSHLANCGEAAVLANHTTRVPEHSRLLLYRSSSHLHPVTSNVHKIESNIHNSL